MVATQTQIEIDQAITEFGYTMEANYTTAEADKVRRGGDAQRLKATMAVGSGYSNAFSQMLAAGSNYAMNKGIFAKK